MSKFTGVVTGVELYSQDNIFSVEVTNNSTGETTFDKYPAERLEEVLAGGAEVEYDEDDKDLEQALGNEEMKYAEVSYDEADGIDVYLHKFITKWGRLERQSTFIKTYQRSSSATKKAESLARLVK